MKTRYILPLLLALTVAPALAETYQIDPNHTNARFAVRHFNTSTNTGGFYEIKGNVQYDPKAHTGSLDITIPTNTIQTGNEHFNNHLKSTDLFNTSQYPTMRFQSSSFVFAGDTLESVEGKLTFLGQTHPITLKAERFNCYQNPMNHKHVCGGDFSATIDRSQWGMNAYQGAVPNEVLLSIQVEAFKQ